MAGLSELEAHELLEDVLRLATEGSTAGDEVREGTQGLRQSIEELLKACGIAPGSKPAQGWWEQVKERERVAVRLRGMQKALQSVVREKDEPNDAANFMYRAHASNEWVVVLVAGSLVIIAAVLWAILEYWNLATSKEATERDLLRMVVLMGALGGTIHWMSSLAHFVGNGNLFRRWSPYYLLSPFQGAALALLVYLMLRVGVLAPNTGQPAQNLNLLGLYAFSALAGLFAKQAIEMLRDVFSVLFKRIEAKDAGQQMKRPAAESAKAMEGRPMDASPK